MDKSLLHTPRKRLDEISLLNSLLCVLVIFIHATSFAVAEYPVNTPHYVAVMIPWRLSSFVVQGFITLSGIKLFLTRKESFDYKSYYISRAKTILVPYMIWSIIYYDFYILFYGYSLDIKFFTLSFLSGYIASHLYFIIIIIQFYLLAPLWRLIVRRIPAAISLPTAFVLTLLCEKYMPSLVSSIFPSFNFTFNDRVFTTYLFYWLCGCYIGKNYEKFKLILKKLSTIVYTAFGIVAAVNIYLSYRAYCHYDSIPYLNYVWAIYAICATFFTYTVALSLPQKFYEGRLFCSLIKKIDKSSFLIYLSHMIFIFLINIHLQKFGITGTGISYLIRLVTVYPAVFLFCFYVTKNKEKIRKA